MTQGKRSMLMCGMHWLQKPSCVDPQIAIFVDVPRVRKLCVAGPRPSASLLSGMSLSDHMYGPHVLVCVRVRGAFQKKKKSNIILQYNILVVFYPALPYSYHVSV